MNFQAVVFDLGGVLVNVDFRRALDRWAAAAGVPPDRLAARFPRDEAYCAHERGELEDRAYFAHLRAVLGIDIDDDAMLCGWNAVLGDPLPGIEPLVARLAREWPLYVLSNTNPAHLAHFTPRYRSLFAHFRKVFVSCELGCRKPEPLVFLRLCESLKLDPPKLVFFDDLEENVAAAQRIGLNAFHVPRDAHAASTVESILQKRSAR